MLMNLGRVFLSFVSICVSCFSYRARFVLSNTFLFCSSGFSCSIVSIYCFSPVFLFIHLVTWFMYLRKVVFQGFSCDSMVVTICFPLKAVLFSLNAVAAVSTAAELVWAEMKFLKEQLFLLFLQRFLVSFCLVFHLY